MNSMGNFKCLPVFLFVLLFPLYQMAISMELEQHGLEEYNSCLPRFNTNQNDYDVCLENECIIFRVEKPYIFLNFSSEEDQKPFLCKKWNEKKDLTGPFFNTINRMPVLNDAYCIWGGDKCTFDDLVRLIHSQARKSAHRFIAGGLLFNLRYRVTEYSIASEPLVVDRLRVIGPRSPSRMSILEAWKRVWEPFSAAAWTFLAVSLMLLLLLRICIALLFTKPKTDAKLRQFLRNLFGEYEGVMSLGIRGNLKKVLESADPASSDVNLGRGEDEVRLARLNSYWMNSVKLVFIISILFYEIAAVFNENRSRLPHAILDPNKFAVIKDSTEEYVTRITLFPGKKGWVTKNNVDQVYDEIFDSTTDTEFTISYEKFNRYMFTKNTTRCKKAQVYETEKNIPDLNAVWYYSSAVPLSRRTEIDQVIMELRESGKMDEIADGGFGSLPNACKTEESKISVALLSVPIFCIVGPIFIFILLQMVYYTTRRRKSGAKGNLVMSSIRIENIENKTQ